MSLAERTTGGDLFWYQRSIRRNDNDQSEGDDEVGDVHVLKIFTTVERHKRTKTPRLEARVTVDVRNRRIELSYDVASRFYFGGDTELPSDAEVAEFMTDYGLDYTFGFVRAALVSDTRLFGLPPLMFPVLTLEEAKGHIPPPRRVE
ncbi:hypothetical protein AB0M12_02060 [Nocardia vinacea]|uniref:hypothetical protein n=1 Tax=Nocardia vinacea TaxID=96468 RepID=UPI003423E286